MSYTDQNDRLYQHKMGRTKGRSREKARPGTQLWLFGLQEQLTSIEWLLGATHCSKHFVIISSRYSHEQPTGKSKVFPFYR